MEAAQNSAGSRLDRELSNLKILSRLLGHELHAQTGARLTMSRDQVLEMQEAEHRKALAVEEPDMPLGDATSEE